MNSHALVKAKNKNSTAPSLVLTKKPPGTSFYRGSTNEARVVSDPGFEHNFGNVQVGSPCFKQTCPLNLSGPSYCPFAGACHTCPPTIQAKLKIGQPGDKYEQEADSVAEQVTSMPEPQVQRKGCLSCNCMDEEDQIQAKPIVGKITPLIQRQTETEEEEEDEVIQTKEVAGKAPEVTSHLQSSIHSMRGGGQPLPASTRAYFEPRFGYDLSQIRIHNNDQSDILNRSIKARAFTAGKDIFFRHGEYNTSGSGGKRLLSHELAHVMQQTGGGVGAHARTMWATDHSIAQKAGGVSQAVMTEKSPSLKLESTPIVLQRAPISEALRKRIKLCIDPFYYDKKGRYTWTLEPKPDCSDITIPADRERAWKCVNKFFWSPDGKKWDWFKPEPDCSDVRLPVPLHEARAESPEERSRREAAERRRKIVEANRARIVVIRDESPSDVEALARMFTDSKIVDDGTIPGRVNAILDATEHTFIPSVHTGIEFKQSGFRSEFHDPWESSINQVGHFLTAVRLAFNPDIASNPILLTILEAWGDSEIPLRLIIGHEKEPDPDIFSISVGYKAQYRSTTDADIRNFKTGNLKAIKVGTGKGNSMADLLLSHKGWILGRWIAKGHFKSTKEIADWIRRTIGTLKK
jgi:hypothetical protein